MFHIFRIPDFPYLNFFIFRGKLKCYISSIFSYAHEVVNYKGTLYNTSTSDVLYIEMTSTLKDLY